MDSYLSIAEAALRLTRRPLTSREIVEVAYRHDLVSSRLFGKTQHKTVGARLSVDILTRRDRSLFFRSEPGKFFLREFLHDPAVPIEYRSPIVARRRERELRRGSPLLISRETAHAAAGAIADFKNKFGALTRMSGFHYGQPRNNQFKADEIQVWSFVIFVRGLEVLTYRHGRYRERRDAFLKRRSIGFFTPVVDRDRDLFDEGDHGIVASGLRAVAIDLDLPPVVFSEHFYKTMVKLTDLVVTDEASGKSDFLAVVSVECPPHFEPLTRRLAINDLLWTRLDLPFNHLEDFDPWSQLVVARVQRPKRQSE